MGILGTALDAVGGSQIKLALIAVAAGVVIAGAAGLAFYVHSLKVDITELTTANKHLEINNRVLTENNGILKDNFETCTKTNGVNNKTITSLVGERKDATAAINLLAAQTAASAATTAKYKKDLEDMLKDPKNDGLVSPALRETIRKIQDGRK